MKITMNDLTTTPTISGLWDKLKAALDTNLEARLTQDTTDSGKHGTPPRLSIAISDAKIKAIRQQLLESATIVPDSGGQSSIFTIDGGTLLIENTVDRLRHDNAETLAEFTAACGFWLSELQQRQVEKEAKGE